MITPTVLHRQAPKMDECLNGKTRCGTNIIRLVRVMFKKIVYSHTGRDTRFKLLLIGITFISLSLSSMLVCCCISKQRTLSDSARSTNARLTKYMEQNATSPSQSKVHRVMISELNQKLQCSSNSASLLMLNNEGRMNENTREDFFQKPPQLPPREYLNDVDFVTREYDLILSQHSRTILQNARNSLKLQVVDVDSKAATTHLHMSKSDKKFHKFLRQHHDTIHVPENSLAYVTLPRTQPVNFKASCPAIPDPAIPDPFIELPHHQQVVCRESHSQALEVFSSRRCLVSQEKQQQIESHQNTREQEPGEAFIYVNLQAPPQEKGTCESNEHAYQPLLVQHGDCDDSQYMTISRHQ